MILTFGALELDLSAGLVRHTTVARGIVRQHCWAFPRGSKPIRYLYVEIPCTLGHALYLVSF